MNLLKTITITIFVFAMSVGPLFAFAPNDQFELVTDKDSYLSTDPIFVVNKFTNNSGALEMSAYNAYKGQLGSTLFVFDITNNNLQTVYTTNLKLVTYGRGAYATQANCSMSLEYTTIPPNILKTGHTYQLFLDVDAPPSNNAWWIDLVARTTKVITVR